MAPTYATATDLTGYVAGYTSDGTTDALLERAERAVDAYVGPFAPRPATGLKIDPVWLERTVGPWARASLARAVCAQAEAILAGKDSDAGAPAGAGAPASVKGPDFEVTYAPSAAPPAELVAAGHLDLRAGAELAPVVRALRPWVSRSVGGR